MDWNVKHDQSASIVDNKKIVSAATDVKMSNSHKLSSSTLGEMICRHRRLSTKQEHSEPNFLLVCFVIAISLAFFSSATRSSFFFNCYYDLTTHFSSSFLILILWWSFVLIECSHSFRHHCALEHAITHSSALANWNDVYCRFASSLEHSYSTSLTFSISYRASQGMLICYYSFVSETIRTFSHSTASIIRPSAICLKPLESSRSPWNSPSIDLFFLFPLRADGSRKSKIHI
jgi:hypothetical protein